MTIDGIPNDEIQSAYETLRRATFGKPWRQTGRTTETLRSAIAAAREGKRVVVLSVSEHDALMLMPARLRRAGATDDDAARIEFFPVTAKIESLRGRAFDVALIDHCAWEYEPARTARMVVVLEEAGAAVKGASYGI